MCDLSPARILCFVAMLAVSLACEGPLNPEACENHLDPDGWCGAGRYCFRNAQGSICMRVADGGADGPSDGRSLQDVSSDSPEGDGLIDRPASDLLNVGPDGPSESGDSECPAPACSLGGQSCGTSGGAITCVMQDGCAVWSVERTCEAPKSCSPAAGCTCPAPTHGECTGNTCGRRLWDFEGGATEGAIVDPPSALTRAISSVVSPEAAGAWHSRFDSTQRRTTSRPLCPSATRAVRPTSMAVDSVPGSMSRGPST